MDEETRKNCLIELVDGEQACYIPPLLFFSSLELLMFLVNSNTAANEVF